MVWALAIGAAGLAWLLFGRQAGPGDAAVDDQQIARDIRTATSAKLAQSRMAESAGAAALGGAALGGAIAGPIGAFVGGMVGAVGPQSP